MGSLRDGGPRPYIWIMQNLELTEDETAALVTLLTRTIDGDRYPLSPRIRALTAILAKLRPEPVREPVPPPTVFAPPRAIAARTRQASR